MQKAMRRSIVHVSEVAPSGVSIFPSNSKHTVWARSRHVRESETLTLPQPYPLRRLTTVNLARTYIARMGLLYTLTHHETALYPTTTTPQLCTLLPPIPSATLSYRQQPACLPKSECICHKPHNRTCLCALLYDTGCPMSTAADVNYSLDFALRTQRILLLHSYRTSITHV